MPARPLSAHMPGAWRAKSRRSAHLQPPGLLTNQSGRSSLRPGTPLVKGVFAPPSATAFGRKQRGSGAGTRSQAIACIAAKATRCITASGLAAVRSPLPRGPASLTPRSHAAPLRRAAAACCTPAGGRSTITLRLALPPITTRGWAIVEVRDGLPYRHDGWHSFDAAVKFGVAGVTQTLTRDSTVRSDCQAVVNGMTATRAHASVAHKSRHGALARQARAARGRPFHFDVVKCAAHQLEPAHDDPRALRLERQ